MMENTYIGMLFSLTSVNQHNIKDDKTNCSSSLTADKNKVAPVYWCKLHWYYHIYRHYSTFSVHLLIWELPGYFGILSRETNDCHVSYIDVSVWLDNNPNNWCHLRVYKKIYMAMYHWRTRFFLFCRNFAFVFLFNCASFKWYGLKWTNKQTNKWQTKSKYLKQNKLTFNKLDITNLCT